MQTRPGNNKEGKRRERGSQARRERDTDKENIEKKKEKRHK